MAGLPYAPEVCEAVDSHHLTGITIGGEHAHQLNMEGGSLVPHLQISMAN
jgi:hypothetical protein